MNWASAKLLTRFSSRHSIGALGRSARLVRPAPRCNQRCHNVLGGHIKLTNVELDALLAKAGLRLDQEHSPRCSYRKTEWLRTACLACGTQADYRLAYILDKNAAGEKVCRACY